MRHTHTASASASDGLDHHRITDALGDDQRVLFVLHDAFGTGWRRHAGLFGKRTADGLVFECAHGARAGTDETDVTTFANFREMGVFGKKTIAGMNGVHIRDFRCTDDAIYAQITL